MQWLIFIGQVEEIVWAVGYLDEPINIKARIGSDDAFYIIEVGPRNGGNSVPIIQQRLSGFDFTSAVIDLSLGGRLRGHTLDAYKSGAYGMVHAKRKEGSVQAKNQKSVFYKLL